MVVKRGDWDRPLARALLTPDGRRLRTLREAAAFVVEQRGKEPTWLSAAQGLMMASLLPNAVDGATESLEQAIATLGPARSEMSKRKQPRRVGAAETAPANFDDQ
jgi:hypothetical protein